MSNKKTNEVTAKTKFEEVSEGTTKESKANKTKTPVYGYVSNCERLNIRKKPDKKAEILTVINAGETVEIDKDLSTSNFYYVIASVSGVEYTGYCMKDFITIK